MNSMIRQHHLRISDIKAYLRTFDRHKPLSPDEWAVQESNLYEPGHLIFCLESVAPPAGLSTFSKRGEEQGETFRVKDLCVVVSKDDGKCVAVIVSPSAYEFRVLDTLLLEKSMRAILDGRDFNYLAARPVQRLDGDNIKALYKLGSNYAKGGSRRTLTAEGAALQEPALALLGQLGAKLSTQVGKQLLDIGSVCHMIFTPEGRQEDKSKSIIKSCFVPVRADDDSSAPLKAATPSGDGQPLYSIDPMSQGANLSENYSSESGNIDLSALAPGTDAATNSFEAPAGAFMDNSLQPALAPGEPNTNFGDFGMGLLSALAPQQPSAAYENLGDNTKAAEPVSLPSVGAMAANMDTLPPSGPTASYADLSSMDNFDKSAFTSPGSSFTGLAGMPGGVLDQAAQMPPTAPPPTVSQEIAQPPAPIQTHAPARFPASASQVNIPAARPQPVIKGRTDIVSPPWFVLSHDAVPTPPGTLAPQATVDTAPQPADIFADQGTTTAPELREDFSQQFLADMVQGHAGSEAIQASEREMAEEQRLKAENERAKEEQLRDQFNAELAQPVDSWQLDPNAYQTPAEPVGPDFDSNIFANAARSTLETNPEARLNETPKEEITGPPPDPSWAVPSILQPPASDALKSDSSFDAMLTAGGALSAPEPGINYGTIDTPGAMPNLGILDALQLDSGAPSASTSSYSSGDNAPAAHELGEPRIPSDTTSGGGDAHSLFDRLTGELSKEPDAGSAANDISAAAPVDPTADTASASALPTTVNWAPGSAIENSGSMWPSISASESLFAQPQEESPIIGSAPAPLAASDELALAPYLAPNESGVAAGQSVESEIKSETFAPQVAPQVESQVQSQFVPQALPEVAIQPAVSEVAPVAAAETAAAGGSEAEAGEPIGEAMEGISGSESQQPRVRPRDYSSPLRTPKPLNAHPSMSPNATPRPFVPTAPLSPLMPNNPANLTPQANSTQSSVNNPVTQSNPVSPSNPVDHTAAPASAVDHQTDAGSGARQAFGPTPLRTKPASSFTPYKSPTPANPAAAAAPSAEFAPLEAAHSPSPEAVQELSQVQPAAAAAATPEPTAATVEPTAATIEPTAALSAPPEPPIAKVTPATIEAAREAVAELQPGLETEKSNAKTSARNRATASSDALTAVGGAKAGAAGAQDGRLMMNEMTSLMSKLELQVAKAANKMASRADELRTRLSQQVDGLVKEAQDIEKQAEGNLVSLASEFKAKLDALSAEVQTSLTKEGQSAADTMESLAQSGWDKLESEQNNLSEEIKSSADRFRLELDRLNSSVSHRLDNLIEGRNKELESLSEQILTQLKESNDAYNQKVAQRYERFEQRTNEETASISTSLERNMRSMVEEIESSLERAVEKLKNTRFELEQTVAHTIAVSEMAIAQKAKLLLTETLLPRLNEQKEIIRTMISDMTRQIVQESTASLDAEVSKLDQGTAHASDKLRTVAEESVAEVEMTGRGIKTGLEDNFKRVSSDLMVRTREVGDKIRETERRMADSEYALKGLAEASSVDSEPELADERNHAVTKLASLKAEASKQLATAIEDNIEHLDSEGERLFSELSNSRAELTTTIRESAESNISKIRQALQEATSAIQTAREKHME